MLVEVLKFWSFKLRFKCSKWMSVRQPVSCVQSGTPQSLGCCDWDCSVRQAKSPQVSSAQTVLSQVSFVRLKRFERQFIFLWWRDIEFSLSDNNFSFQSLRTCANVRLCAFMSVERPAGNCVSRFLINQPSWSKKNTRRRSRVVDCLHLRRDRRGQKKKIVKNTWMY